MGRNVVRGAGVGLVVGLGLGYPVSQWYREDIESYTTVPLIFVGVVLMFPAGWLLARTLRITHPIVVAFLGPVLLLVCKNAADAAVPDARPGQVMVAFTVLAMVGYAAAAGLTSTASLVPRIVAAVTVCACVITTTAVEQRRTEAREQRHREDLIAFYKEKIPLAVPAAVPGRTLVQVGSLAETMLELQYAKSHLTEPDVFVRISDDQDAGKACAMWERESDGCERLADGRWLSKDATNGRKVLFAMVDDRLVEVDTITLSLDAMLAAVSGLRAVSAEDLVDFESPSK